MIIIRKTTHVVMMVLSLQVASVFSADQQPAHAANFWDSVSGWFSHQVKEAEKVADKMGDEVEQAAKKASRRVRAAARKAKAAVKAQAAQAGGMADRIVEPIVERAGVHMQRHMEPVIKKGLKHVEKQAEPMLARTEKRIQQNIARTVRAYCFAALGGIASVFILRQTATVLARKENPSAVGAWLHKQNESASGLVADVMIGAMLGMGIYGLTQVDADAETVPAK